MTSFRSRWVCTALAAALTAAAGTAGAQGVVKNTFGDWQMRCETPPGAKSEQCALVQNVMAEDRPNLTLLVIALKTADGKSRLLRMVAPLGILIPAGIGLRIDQADIGRAGYVRCLTTGCIAEAVLDDTLLESAQGRPDRDLHRVPDAGGRRRRAGLAERLRGRVRRPAVSGEKAARQGRGRNS